MEQADKKWKRCNHDKIEYPMTVYPAATHNKSYGQGRQLK